MIEFEIPKETLKRIIKSHKKFSEYSENNPLRRFQFKLTGDSLKVLTTDGSRALESVVGIKNITNKDCAFSIDAALIKELTVYKTSSLYITVIVDDKNALFIDKSAGITQKYTLVKSESLDFSKIFNNSSQNMHTIFLNNNFFKDLQVLLCNEYNPFIELNINKNNPEQPIVVKTVPYAQNEDKVNPIEIKQTALLLPVHNTKSTV